MGKRFKGKLCAYCSELSETGDHIFPRSFFQKSDWAGLPQVPACLNCNGEKSKLENYLATTLLFGGRHVDAHTNLIEMGERRLAKNSALHRKLQRGVTDVWLKDKSGFSVRSMALPIDDRQFSRFFEYVIKGLIRHEFNQTLGTEDYVAIHTITSLAGEPMFRNYLALNAAARAQRDIGRGAFIYEGAQGTDNPHISVWLLSAFGGLLMQDGDGQVHETRIGALTGPRRIAERVALRQKWLEGRGTFAG